MPSSDEASPTRPRVDRPWATLGSGLAVTAACAWGFTTFAAEAPARNVSEAVAARTLLIFGLLGAAAVTAWSYQLLHKPRATGVPRGGRPRGLTSVGVGVCVLIATVLLSLTGSVFYASLGLLFGALGGIALIASLRAALALLALARSDG